MEKQLNTLGWKYSRFNAIKHKSGALGCSMSHLALLQQAKEKQLDYIVIVEDDITFTNMELFKKQFEKIWNSNIHYDVLLLGGNVRAPYTKINDVCVQVYNCQTTIGYIVKKHFYDILIDNFSASIDGLKNDLGNISLYACDMYWKPLQKKYTFLFLIPPTITQIPNDYSDIALTKCNYSSAMLNIDKK